MQPGGWRLFLVLRLVVSAAPVFSSVLVSLPVSVRVGWLYLRCLLFLVFVVFFPLGLVFLFIIQNKSFSVPQAGVCVW